MKKLVPSQLLVVVLALFFAVSASTPVWAEKT